MDRHRVELPLPRRSVKIKRLNEASRCRWPATVGSSHSRSIGNGEGGTKRRSGPRSPTIWYARWASPSRAYSVSGLAEQKWHVKPGTFVKVPAYKQHSVTNTGTADLIFLVIYDPPLNGNGTP